MQKTLELNYGRSLKINKGNYEQDAPMWHEKVILGFNGETEEEIAVIQKGQQEAMEKRVNERADSEWTRYKLELANIRIRTKEGKKYPSVTSILNPDPLPIDPAYAKRGQEIHRLINRVFETGHWEEPIVDISPLKYDQIKYKEFFVTYGKQLLPKHLNLEIYHEDHLFSGEIDFYGIVDGKLTLLDFKTGSWKWEQLAAYGQCVKIEQYAIADLKNAKLILKTPAEMIEAWEKFLVLRGVFQSRFGL